LKIIKRWKCFEFHKNFCGQFQVDHQKRGQLATKSLKYESLEKCDNIKLEGDFHHKDVVSMSNLRMTPEALFHYLCSLKLVRSNHAQRHEFKERKKKLQSKSIQQ